MIETKEIHDQVKNFDWEPSYFERQERYPTKYKIPGKTKDPFKHLLRDYVTMEEEKDDRQYGALEDALARSGAPGEADQGWMEVMKFALPMVHYTENGALKCMAQASEAIQNEELRQGYLFQAQDEIRHINQMLYLSRYFARHAPDPEGFNCGMRVRNSNFVGRAARAATETFFTGDPIECVLSLQIIGETCYTNPFFVVLTEIAARNGDHATPSVFLSIQSDESRHMANGYATLAAVLSEPENHPHLQADLDRVFWRGHTVFDSLFTVMYDYYASSRSFSYLEKWNEWVKEDWVGSYIGKLEPFGLKAPRWFGHAEDRIGLMGHSTAMATAAAWPLLFWRVPQLTERDYEWFESKYPGWHAQFGAFWDAYASMKNPKEGMFPFMGIEGQDRPPMCTVCQVPAIFPTMDNNTGRTAGYNGELYPFCSEPCEFIFFEEPQRYLGAVPFDVEWDGVSLEEYIIKNDLLRGDGKTLLAQPHLGEDDTPMWTIDDIAKCNWEIRDPLREKKAEYRKAHAAAQAGGEALVGAS